MVLFVIAFADRRKKPSGHRRFFLVISKIFPYMRNEEKYGILMTKEMEKEVDRMCNLSQIFVDKGIERGLVLGESKGKAEGRAEGRLEGKEESNVACVRSLSKHLSINYEEAMDLLEIEEALRPSVMERLHHPKDRETAE